MKGLNFTRAALALSLAGFMSGVALADELDSEIAKLKKENELLELKHKKEALKKGIKPSSDTKETAEAGEYSLSGFFVGAEVGYSPSVQNYMSMKQDLDYTYDYQKNLRTAH